jgi:hypothetical protein
MPQKSLSNDALERMHGVCLGVAEKMGFQLMELTGEADNLADGGGCSVWAGGLDAWGSAAKASVRISP